MIFQVIFMSLSFGLAWMGITGRVSVESFLVGFVLSALTVWALLRLGVRFDVHGGAGRPTAFLAFFGHILMDALIGSIQVTRLILRPKLELRTGIVALKTGDPSPEQQLAALSAQAINMTPGQLVIEFGDEGTLYLHCLDIDSALPTLDAAQARRIALLRQMMGVKDGD